MVAPVRSTVRFLDPQKLPAPSAQTKPLTSGTPPVPEKTPVPTELEDNSSFVRSQENPEILQDPRLTPGFNKEKSAAELAVAAPPEVLDSELVTRTRELPQAEKKAPETVTVTGEKGEVQVNLKTLDSERLKAGLDRRLKRSDPQALQQQAEQLQSSAERVRGNLPQATQAAKLEKAPPLLPTDQKALAALAKLGASPEQAQQTLEMLKAGVAVKSDAAARMIEQLNAMVQSKDAIDFAKASLLFLMQARQFEQQQPALAKQFGIQKINQLTGKIVDSAAQALSLGNGNAKAAWTRILNRYVGRPEVGQDLRAAGADADQRINDLAALLDMYQGKEKADPVNAGRILFEFALDNGTDVKTLANELFGGLKRQLSASQKNKLELAELRGELTLLKSAKMLSQKALGELAQRALQLGGVETLSAMLGEGLNPDSMKALYQAAKTQGDDALKTLLKAGLNSSDENLKMLLQVVSAEGDEGLQKLFQFAAAEGGKLEKTGHTGFQKLLGAAKGSPALLEKLMHLGDSLVPKDMPAGPARELAKKAEKQFFRAALDVLDIKPTLKSALKESLETGKELVRYALRYATDSSAVGKTAHAIDFLKTLAHSRFTGLLVGEKGQTVLKELGTFLELDNFSQAHLKKLFDKGASVSDKVDALSGLAKTLHQKVQHLTGFDKVAQEAFDDAFKGFAKEMGVPPQAIDEGLKQAAQSGGTPKKVPDASEAKTTPRQTPDTPSQARPSPERVPDSPTKPRPVPDKAPTPAPKAPPAAHITPPAQVARQTVDEGTQALGKLKALGQKLNLSANSIAELEKMAAKLSPNEIKNLTLLLEKVGAQHAELAVKTLQAMPNEIKKALTVVMTKIGPDKSIKTIDAIASMIKSTGDMLMKMDLPYHKILPQIGKKLALGIVKILPAVGGALSAYDMYKFTDKALDAKKYPDPNVRALALMGAAVNFADTGMAVAEAFGVGNVLLPGQIGAAVVSIALDIAVEHYNKNPMPKSLASKIEKGAAIGALVMVATAPATGVGGPLIAAGLIKIYGAKKLIATLKSMGADGQKTLDWLKNQGMKQLSDLAGKAGHEADEALAALSSLAKEGGDLADEALNELGSLIKAGGATARRALAEVQKLGRQGAQYLVNMALKGEAKLDELLSTLSGMGAAGKQALGQLLDAIWEAPDKYMAMLEQLVSHYSQDAVVNYLSEKLQGYLDQGLSEGGKALLAKAEALYDQASLPAAKALILQVAQQALSDYGAQNDLNFLEASALKGFQLALDQFKD